MDTSQLPEELINFVKKAKTVTCTSLKLLSYNDRINESLTEVYLMSDASISTLLGKIKENVGILYKLSESIALLDMLLSFASYATFVESSIFVILNSTSLS
jgi:DNA mismatch repair protein MSH4